ncbi:FGGY-family carbohydrate kinase [Pacificoceanicola onchidii]|uniref:FGGY-family carbohydrate kinase n=1 Tax=Pacificoceanicola onchidii TaxID=2562685 RepID=UPI0010A659FF|nr:FGGY family carbohydrate kinase [Pacificoceanicola onchidii]
MSKTGIAVIDVGATNSKVILFDDALNEIDSRKVPTVHMGGPPYTHLDDASLMAFATDALVELDRKLPIDTISISAFGATVACLDGQGQLTTPVMDYLAEAPAELDAEFAKITPPFSEVFSNTSPCALTIGKQLFWLETLYPDAFARTETILPWSAYIGYRLGGRPAMEISNLGVFTHLLDVKSSAYSSLVTSRGWDKKFPEILPAWQVIGQYKPEGFRGRGDILCGIHDSNANWLRYLSGHEGSFTLLSTGTFVIGFDSDTELDDLNPDTDVFSFTDIFAKPVACSRFYGGYEFEKVLDGVAPTKASAEGIAAIIAGGVFALPAFSDTGGPIADRGNRGQIIGDFTEGEVARASLATLYAALMINELLDTLGSTSDIIIDGPFAQNTLVAGIIGQLRPGQKILASELRDGTAMGAAILGQMKGGGTVPSLPIPMKPCAASAFDGLSQYRDSWHAHIASE